MLVLLLVVCVAGAGLMLAHAGDDAHVSTASDGAPVRWFPEALPAEVALIWVDDHPEVTAPSANEEWAWDAKEPAYEYGFRDARVQPVPPTGDPTAGIDLVGQLRVEIYPGWSLPAEAVAADLEYRWRTEDPGMVAEVRQDSEGRAAVSFEDHFGSRTAMFELDGAVARVFAEGPADTIVTLDELDAFIHSFRPIDDAAWRVEIAGADVAPPYGKRDPIVTLVDGGGWRLDQYAYRSQGQVGRTVADVIIDGKTIYTDPAAPDYEMYGVLQDDGSPRFIQLQLDEIPSGGIVAWGVAPADVATIRFSLSDTTTDVATIAFGADRIFAVELPDAPMSATAFDPNRRELDIPVPLLRQGV